MAAFLFQVNPLLTQEKQKETKEKDTKEQKPPVSMTPFFWAMTHHFYLKGP